MDWRNLRTSVNSSARLPGFGKVAICCGSNLDGSGVTANFISSVVNSIGMTVDDIISTPITLVSFTARGMRSDVKVLWETAAEIETAGFHIWRRAANDKDFVRVTSTIIPAEGGPFMGAAYFWVDTGIEPDTHYWYKLEDISYSGISAFSSEEILEQVGPAQACSPAPCAIFIPSSFALIRLPIRDTLFIPIAHIPEDLAAPIAGHRPYEDTTMKRMLLAVVTLLLLLPGFAWALDTETRVVSPVRLWNEADLATFHDGWLYVKFVEGSDVLLRDGRFSDDSGLQLQAVNGLLEIKHAAEIRPTFKDDRARFRRLKAVGEAKSGVTGPDLSLWFTLQVPGDKAALAATLNALNADPAVEIAHPAPKVELATVMPDRPAKAAVAAPGGTPDFTGEQDYLYDTPVGLNAPSAWSIPGGKGAGMKFIDVELSWVEDHEDFTADNHFYLGGEPEEPGYGDHGTAVLGEVVGTHNSYGVDGFAPDVDFGMVAIDLDLYPDTAPYFQEAVDNLDAGDVWLIELQMYPPGRDATPMEYVQVNYDVIWTGTFSRGVVCVEAGANGSQDLDASHWSGIFDRTMRDSGAIMVGAGTPTGRVAEYFTNYGTRMDVNAWGSSIYTCGYGDAYNGGTLQTEYTASFGGTSGASPMIVGSSLCLQGIAKANLLRVLDPLELRGVLHDTGTEHLDPSREIGPRPDLDEAAEMVLSLGSPVVICGPGPGLGNPPLVRLFPPEQDADMLDEFPAYGASDYGVNVAFGTVGVTPGTIVTGAGPGDIYGPHVRGFSGDGTPLSGLSFFAYGTLKYGVNVAIGDLDGDGGGEIVTGAGPGAVFGPHVRAFSYDGSSVSALSGVSYFAYGTNQWGVNLCCGDIDGDGYAEIVTGAGPGAIFGPHVRGWNVDGGAVTTIPAVSYFAYGTNRMGVNVACGDVDGDGIDEIVTAPGPSGLFGAHIRGWNYDGATLAAISGINFFAWDYPAVRYGARVSSGIDYNGDGNEDMLVGPGPDPAAPAQLKVFGYDGSDTSLLFSLNAFDTEFTHGINAAGGTI